MELTTIKANCIPYSELVEKVPYYEVDNKFIVYRLESSEGLANFLVLDEKERPVVSARCDLIKRVFYF